MKQTIIARLQQLEQKSIKRGIPILGSQKGAWLLQQVQKLKPKRILELGTANGYSGCILGSEGADLTTVEIDDKIAEEAVVNFAAFDIKANIILGDGVEIVGDLARQKKEYYDLIFIDFSKKNYIKVLEQCIKLVRQDGLIIADNISFENCQDFKEAVLAHPKLETEIISIKDGLSCSRKREV